MEVLVHSSKIHAPVEDVFNWHIREGAFERLNPPWQPFSVVGSDYTINLEISKDFRITRWSHLRKE
jgi:uncharacterized protein